MPATYPSTFPKPTVAGFGVTVASGVIRSEQPNQQSQRRAFSNMPQQFTLQWTMKTQAWSKWQPWMTENGFSWFYINLGGAFAGKAGTNTSAHLIRLTSDIQAVPVGADVVQINATAEAAPSMASQLI